MKIAVILTCFNRKQKTLSCLKSLFEARNYCQQKMDLHVYLTDDGCADGTADAVRNTFPDENICILQGDGNLFWAGGMRLAWKEAIKRHSEWDYYFLLNDDTVLYPDLFGEMLSTRDYCIAQYKKEGIYSGGCGSSTEKGKLTYGGRVFVNRYLDKSKKVGGDGVTPVLCDISHANVLWVHKTVVDEIGMFYEGYRHGYADYDYAVMARKHHIPVLVTANICAICDNDHEDWETFSKRIKAMTIRQRKEYFSSPIHSTSDRLKYTRRTCPLRFPFVWIMRQLNVYLPSLYYSIHGR